MKWLKTEYSLRYQNLYDIKFFTISRYFTIFNHFKNFLTLRFSLFYDFFLFYDFYYRENVFTLRFLINLQIRKLYEFRNCILKVFILLKILINKKVNFEQFFFNQRKFENYINLKTAFLKNKRFYAQRFLYTISI